MQYCSLFSVKHFWTTTATTFCTLSSLSLSFSLSRSLPLSLSLSPSLSLPFQYSADTKTDFPANCVTLSILFYESITVKCTSLGTHSQTLNSEILSEQFSSLHTISFLLLLINSVVAFVSQALPVLDTNWSRFQQPATIFSHAKTKIV